MDQTDELSYDAVVPHGQTPPPVQDVQVASPSTIDDLLQQATQKANEGGPGAHADEAQDWLNQQMEGMKGTRPTGTANDPDVMEYGDVKPVAASASPGKELSFDTVKPIGSPDFSKVQGSVVEPPGKLEGALNKVVDVGGTYAKHGMESLANLGGSVGAYFKNYHENHETFEPGPVTPEERIAAKLMGMSTPGNANVVQDPNSPYYDPQSANAHGQVYKLTPKQREDLNDKAMEAWGLTPKEQRARVEASASGDWKDLDVVGGVTTNSLMANVAERVANPQIANTRKYYALQDTVKAMDAVAHPEKYDPSFVKESIAKINVYKKQLGQSNWDSVKEMWDTALKEPGKTVKSLAYGIAQDPELLGVPEVKLGSLAMAPKIARAIKAAQEASTIAKLADAVKGASSTADMAANAAKNSEVYGRVAQRAGDTGAAAKRAAGLGDTASVIGAGAGLNTVMAAQEQMRQQGYVRDGSLGAPAIAGAAFGSVARGASALFAKEGGLVGDLKDRVDEETLRETGPNAGPVPDVNAGKKPGEPLSPETPINKNSHVPYYGGVDATGKVIHIDKDTPSNLAVKNLDGKKVNIPVLKTVAYHEQVEYPLMHLEGPMQADTLAQLQIRIGQEGTIPKDVLAKLQKGESLSYPEAHEIATHAENHLVRTLYKTDPKVYQDSLKPYIKDVGKANKDAKGSDIPAGLDTKPYDDMGHPEVLKGQGDLPPVDKVPTGQKGNVSGKILATGTAVGLGATAGSLLAPGGEKKAGAYLGGAAGLFAGMNMWGDAIPNKGLGNKERGIFAGPLARTHNTFKETVANRLEREGATPQEVYQQTGLHRAAGGKWAHELSDQGISINEGLLAKTNQRKGGTTDSYPLGEVLKHSELSKAYPGLMNNLKVREVQVEGVGGYYDPQEHSITINDPSYLRWLAKKTGDPALLPEAIIAHEVQHAIQHHENMPSGDSPRYQKYQLELERDGLETRWETLRVIKAEAQVSGDWEKANKVASVLDEISDRLEKYSPEAIDREAARRYNKSAGEQQAVNVQKRMDMTPEERAASYPESTMTTPIKDQLVRYNEDQAQYHQLPLDEQLKKTGDSDEDGNLHGMVLDEDRLPNERVTIEKAKTGDQRAIGDLYKKYMPRLERTLRSLMRDAGPRLGIDSEDIASQAFMKAMQSIHSFEGNSAFYTWLYKIGRNEALNAIDKGNRQVPTSSMFRATSDEPGVSAAQGGIESTGGSSVRPDVESIASTHDTPEAMAVAQQASNMVKHAISKLPQDIREAVKMKDLAGMTEQEIADAMGVPLGTVKSRLSRGRDMIQQSIKRGHGAQFRSQGGFATPESLKKVAKIALLGGGGATLGAMYLNPEHPIKGAWAGAALALVGGEVNWSKLYPSLKAIREHDPRFNVNDVLNDWDTAKEATRRSTSQLQDSIKKMIPDKVSQDKVTHWLDGDKSIPLTNSEYQAAQVARKFYDSLGQAANNAGVLKDFLQNYVNHEWGDSAKAKALQKEIEGSFPTNMSPKDRHALARKFMTLEQGKATGLTPKTENIVDLIGIYSDSMSRAMANKTLLDALKVRKLDPKGEVSALMSAGKAPMNYVPINHPQLANKRVHPSIAPSLDFLFHMKNREGIVPALESANTAIKRMQVSFSLFHVKALIDAHLGANTLMGTFKNLYDIATAASGKTEYHKQYKTGGPGDVVDMGIKGGLKTDMGGHVSSEDVRANDLYDTLDRASKFMDSMVPGTGAIPTLIKKANKISDKFIWENVHTGLKGMTFMNVYERMQRRWAGEMLKDPTAKIPTNEEIARQAASFVNDTFGGLNWRRLADDATTKYGRAFALAMANPAGRRLSQVMLFAPDWTYSTLRSFIKSVDKGSGLRGLLQPKYMADLHRQYIIRSAFIYLTLYNAVNLAFSGHPIWDNKDPLTVDLGNGERMQANKHFMETPHALINPAKFVLGKLGTVPSEILAQTLHKEYVTPGYSPDMKSGRIEHAASRVLPFAMSGGEEQGWKERLASMAGFPIYGRPMGTQEEKDAAKAQRSEAAKKGAETRRQKKLKELYGE